MQRRIGSLDIPPEKYIEGYPIYIAENVKTINAIRDKEEYFGWSIEEANGGISETTQICLYVDGAHDDPFGHWVFECGIFLPLYCVIKRHIPNLRLLSYNPKKYKTIFYKAYDIDESDIVSKLDEKNVVFFTQWNSLGDHIPERRDRFLQHVRLFYDTLISKMPPLSKPTSLLYLPRGIKENYKSNDRTISAQGQLIEHITNAIPNSRIYDTDDTENILDQLTVVRSTKYILLDYGSSLLVNGFFGENTTFFVIGDFGHIHCKNPKPYLMLNETIRRGCKYYYIPVHWPAFYILSFVIQQMNNPDEGYKHSCICWKDCLDCKGL